MKLKKWSRIAAIIIAIMLVISMLIVGWYVFWYYMLFRALDTHLEEHQPNLIDNVLEYCKNHDEFRFSDVTNFEWDVLYVDYGSHTIEEIFGLEDSKLTFASNGFGFDEELMVLAFGMNSEFVAYEKVIPGIVYSFYIELYNSGFYDEKLDLYIFTPNNIFTVRRTPYELNGEIQNSLTLTPK